MKAKILIITLLIASLGLAQEQDSIKPKKNIIKTNLTSIPFRNYQLTYERSLAKWFSISATYGMIPEGEIPLLDKFLDQEETDEIQDLEDIKLKGSTITIETRFYLGGKDYSKGFYIAPYYRYANYELSNLQVNYPINLDNEPEYDVPLDVSGEVKSHNFGLVMGTQFLLGKKHNWVIDFWFLGAHYGMAEGNLDGLSAFSLSTAEQQQIEQDILEEDIPIVEYDVAVNGNGARVTIDGPWAGIRAGLSFGFRF